MTDTQAATAIRALLAENERLKFLLDKAVNGIWEPYMLEEARAALTPDTD